MNVKKMAAQDAAKWAYAEMFFGEGAGTRRKLLDAEIWQKGQRLGEKYQQAFDAAYAQQDFAKLAIQAAKERQRIDHVSYIGKNVRALVRGDVRNMSVSFIMLAGGAYYAHILGYDKKAYDWAKVEYQMAKKKAERWWAFKTEPKAKHHTDDQGFFDINKPYGGL